VSLRLLIALLLCAGHAAAQARFTPIIGGLPFDSGFALGVQYDQPRLARTPVDFRTRVIGSVKKYEYGEAQLLMPRVADGLVFVELGARYRNYPEEDFWGLGPRSSRDLRSTYRVEDATYTGTAGFRPAPWLTLGAMAARMDVNAGPGKDRGFPSIEELFDPAEAPALDHQPDFWLAGAFLAADYRDQPTDPRCGGFYQFRWTRYDDLDFDRFHFHRYEFDLRQYFPTFHPRAGIAARALALLSARADNQRVPFFFMPTVGGGNDLRGYHQYRFRDENILLFNLEYRHRVHQFVQIVVFGDAGRVSPRPSQLGVDGRRGSVGTGVRFRLVDWLQLGLDLGWSPEGFRLWFRGGDTY
jgi:hypothetical protein